MDPYRKELFKVSKELTSDEVEGLMFLNGDKFGDGQKESIKKPLDLFNLLLSRDYISKTDSRYLIELLISIERKDLVRKYFDENTGTFLVLANSANVPDINNQHYPPSGVETYPQNNYHQFQDDPNYVTVGTGTISNSQVFYDFPPGTNTAEIYPSTQQQFRPASPSYSSIASSAGGQERENGGPNSIDDATTVEISSSEAASSEASGSSSSTLPPPVHRLATLKQVDFDGGTAEAVSSDGCLAAVPVQIAMAPHVETSLKVMDCSGDAIEPVSSDGCPLPASRPKYKLDEITVDFFKAVGNVLLGVNEDDAALAANSVNQQAEVDVRDPSDNFHPDNQESLPTLPALSALAANTVNQQANVDIRDPSDDVTPDNQESLSALSAHPTNVESVFQALPLIAETGKVDHARILPHLGVNVQLRSYQLSLSEPGLKGQNSIVVLQTGGGKTHIAAYVTKYHSEKAAAEGKKFRCLFLVPIRHLSEQQEKVFHDAFGSKDCAIVRKNCEFSKSFEEKSIIFCTAQILVNILENPDRYGIKMSQFSMIALDECHHTVGSHPNNHVMQHYMRTKFETPDTNQVESETYRVGDTHLPLILGLSASLGAGEKRKDGGLHGEKFQMEAVKHLKLVCSNLDSPTVVFPQGGDLESLCEACPTVANEKLISVKQRDDVDFHVALREFVLKVMDLVRGSKEMYDGIELGKLEYNSSIDKIIKDTSLSIDELSLATYMKEFNKAFALLLILRAVDVLDYISASQELPFFLAEKAKIRADLSNVPFIRKVQNLWMDSSPSLREKATVADMIGNPILGVLKKKLMEMFANPDARGIVLVEMRYSTKAIIEFIRSDPQLKERVRPITLVGQTEMSDFVVKENLSSFRVGKDNLLVATDIAQEGLDIPQCNFVIRYHFVSNEVGAIQAVGRARMENSQCYLMVVKGSEEEKRHERVQKFIKAMESALSRHLDYVREGRWMQDIDKHQKKVHETRKEKMARRKGKEIHTPVNYVIVCAGCKTEITGAFNIVKIKETNHHLVNDEDVETKIHRVYNATDNGIDVYCAQCRVNKLGIEVGYQKGCYYRGSWVALSAEGIKYRNVTKEDKRALPPFRFAWKNAPFEVKVDSYSVEIDELDMQDMLLE